MIREEKTFPNYLPMNKQNKPKIKLFLLKSVIQPRSVNSLKTLLSTKILGTRQRVKLNMKIY